MLAYKLFNSPITSIRVFNSDAIKVTICSNKNTFIDSKLQGYKLVQTEIPRDLLVQDARYVANGESHNLLTVGFQQWNPTACIQDETMTKNRPIYENQSLVPEILDISEEGLILADNQDGLIYLRHSTNESVKFESYIGNSLENNYGGVRLLIPSKVGHSIFYAGQKYAELNVVSFTPGSSFSELFLWQSNFNSDRNFISSIDYYQDHIVLGSQRSIILFSLGANSLPREPQELCRALEETAETLYGNFNNDLEESVEESETEISDDKTSEGPEESEEESESEGPEESKEESESEGPEESEEESESKGPEESEEESKSEGPEKSEEESESEGPEESEEESESKGLEESEEESKSEVSNDDSSNGLGELEEGHYESSNNDASNDLEYISE